MNVWYFLTGIIVLPSFAAIEMSVTPSKCTAVPIQIIYVHDKHEKEVASLATQMQQNFMFTGQFNVETKVLDAIPDKKALRALHEQGTLFVLVLIPFHKGYEWHLYDTMQATLVGGKKYHKRGDLMRGWAHNISDDVWKVLTGNEGFFSTKIAYSKMIRSARGKDLKYICIADYDGSNEQVLVDSKTINVAPRWNNDRKNPLLFYSDFTNHNVRLMISDLHKRKMVASNFDGVNMVPSFSSDGKKLVYCLSRGDGHCQLYFCEKGVFKKLTNNSGNNVSPTYADEINTVFFCSDFETGSPQIYAQNMTTKELERITSGGYCASPRYSHTSKKIAYAKLINGTMQLCIYDVAKKTHTQITSDQGNKEEFAWSPCGTRLIYSVEIPGKSSRLSMINLVTNDSVFLTGADTHCTYPDWSPVYEAYPIMTV